MPPTTAGQILVLAVPGPVHAAPVVGRLAAVATNANVVQLLANLGSDFAGGDLATITLSDVELAASALILPLSALSAAPTYPGRILHYSSLAAGLGPEIVDFDALVLWAGIAEINATSVSPFNGATNPGEAESDYFQALYYVEVMCRSGGTGNLNLGAERLYIVGTARATALEAVAPLPAGWTNGTAISNLFNAVTSTVGY